MQDLLDKIKAAHGGIKHITFAPDEELIKICRSLFARDLGDDEQVLFIGDKFDLLVSNTHAYGNGQRIALQDIYTATYTGSSFLEHLTNNSGECQLNLNGEAFILTGENRLPRAFLLDALPKLGDAARHAGLDAEQVQPNQRAMMAAAAVCAHQNRSEVTRQLIATGMSSKEATLLLNFLNQRYKKTVNISAILLTLGGLTLAVFAFILSMALSAGGWMVIWTGGVTVGLLFFISGLWSLLSGKAKIDWQPLAMDWLKAKAPSSYAKVRNQPPKTVRYTEGPHSRRRRGASSTVGVNDYSKVSVIPFMKRAMWIALFGGVLFMIACLYHVYHSEPTGIGGYIFFGIFSFIMGFAGLTFCAISFYNKQAFETPSGKAFRVKLNSNNLPLIRGVMFFCGIFSIALAIMPFIL